MRHTQTHYFIRSLQMGLIERNKSLQLRANSK